MLSAEPRRRNSVKVPETASEARGVKSLALGPAAGPNAIPECRSQRAGPTQLRFVCRTHFLIDELERFRRNGLPSPDRLVRMAEVAKARLERELHREGGVENAGGTQNSLRMGAERASEQDIARPHLDATEVAFFF